MGLYLPVKLQGKAAIAVCDRCKRKVYYDELSPDGNSPGLRVCKGCNDQKDPYRLPARQTEIISLRYPRPDDMGPLDPRTVISTEEPTPVDFPPEVSP